MLNTDNTIKVIALDPGVTTGHAVGVIDDGKLGAVSGQDTWDEYQLYLQLKFAKPNVLIYERFEYRRDRDRAELFSRNLIGVIHLYAQEREANDDHLILVHQMPAQVMKFFT